MIQLSCSAGRRHLHRPTSGLSATASSLSSTAASTHHEALPEEKERQASAMAALVDSMEREPRHGIRGALVKEFFSTGSSEGPFPGARSSQGEFMASTFYAHAKTGTSMATLKPSHYSSAGYKLKT